MYITSSSTISYQPTFKNLGFSSSIAQINASSQLLAPDYGKYIPPMERRRMTEAVKTAICCTHDCLEQSKIEQPNAIIVGTSMGCCINTKTFLNKIHTANNGLLAPTSFITSTHNTIAGQISLLLKNHSYNNTHTHNSLSFEHALIDALMCLHEGCENALVGAVDEFEEDLYNMSERLNVPQIIETSGASFFTLQAHSNDTCSIFIKAADLFVLLPNIRSAIEEFLKNNSTSKDDIDLILFSESQEDTSITLNSLFTNQKKINYQALSGTYYTNSAFALSYAYDLLNDNSNKSIKKILICNNLITENLGLILVQKEEK